MACDESIKNRCSLCNIGYYLDLDEGKCHSCEVENFINCSQKGICIKCIDQHAFLNGECHKTCELGKKEKCLECDNNDLRITQNCLSCNKGYYLPDDSENKTICTPCDLGCTNCSGKKNKSICSLCEDDYILYNGKCIKECIIGDGELCKTCDFEDNEKNCGSCNDGYYLPYNINERKICLKCGINMTKCHQDINNDIIPDECIYPYIASGKYCLKKCETGTKTECSSCSQKPGEINLCGKCYTGYYLPSDSNKIY